jgi:hypothetical protein
MLELRDVGSSFRHFYKVITAFGRAHPKKVEAIGLFAVLVSVFMQLQADRYQREIAEFELKELRGEVTLTRDKVMGLIECQSKGTCQDYDHDRIKTESDSFLHPKAPESYQFWQVLRFVVFVFGSVFILIGKWLDGSPIRFFDPTRRDNEIAVSKEQAPSDV